MLAVIVAIALAIPPAAKVLGVILAVYGVLQNLKRIPALAAYLKGWVAVAFNVALAIGGVVAVIPADQLYTWNTLALIVQAIAGAAGIHGTVTLLKQQNQTPQNTPPAQ